MNEDDIRKLNEVIHKKGIQLILQNIRRAFDRHGFLEREDNADFKTRLQEHLQSVDTPEIHVDANTITVTTPDMIFTLDKNGVIKSDTRK